MKRTKTKNQLNKYLASVGLGNRGNFIFGATAQIHHSASLWTFLFLIYNNQNQIKFEHFSTTKGKHTVPTRKAIHKFH
jgi:hypothetical protein